MGLQELLREIEDRGVALFPIDGRLRFRPKRNLTPELVDGLREHKAAILEALEHREATLPIRTTGEVLVMARSCLGEIAPEHCEDPPFPPPEEGRDPLVHRHTAKAMFFRGVRERDLGKRRRNGMPRWIRLVSGDSA